jgi:hypothetical protein
MAHGPHSSTLVVICVVQLLFVLFCVLFVCKCVLPLDDNPIAVNKFVIWRGGKLLQIAWGLVVPLRGLCPDFVAHVDVLTSNISFIRVPNTEKCDVTASNGTHQSANSRRGHMT